MSKINLARALKEKKRIIGRINEITPLFQQNVFEVDNAPAFTLKEKFNILQELKNHLITLKELIVKANAESGITKRIYEMEEKKADLAIWMKMDTDTSPARRRDYETDSIVEIKKSAFYSFEEVSNNKELLRKEIERLQDEIDMLNGSTMIEYPFELL